jgi:sugar-phosphatase
MVEILCRGLLFDLDGVLIDSTPAVARVWTKWAIAHGFDPEETVRRAHGRPSIATIRDLLPDADHAAENEVVLRGEIEDTEGVIPLPGARELLDSVPGACWVLVTSCSRPLAEVRLRTADLPIPDKMVTSDDVVRGKPDPEPYLKGAELLGVPASGCLVFEDAPAGVRSGKAAGARVMALRSTSTDAELGLAGADWILSGYDRLQLVGLDHGANTLRLHLREIAPFRQLACKKIVKRSLPGS